MHPSRNAVVQDQDSGLGSAVSEIEKMAKAYVIVGFPAGTKTHAQDKNGRHKKAGLSMPQIAAQNEFGTDKIPARPFLYNTVDENREKINNQIGKEYTKVVEGQKSVKAALSLIGLFVQKMVTDKIDAIHFPPNSPATIKRKGSSKPLIDFGQMRQAVTFKVYNA